MNRLLRLATLIVSLAPALGAQDESRAPWIVLVGSVAEDRTRMDQLRGFAPSAGWLVRTATLMNDRDVLGLNMRLPGVCVLSVEPLPISSSMTWNSEIPFARNDVGVWAGRGATIMLSGGVRAQCGRLRVQLRPEGWYAQNTPFQVLPSGNANRSGFASPFHSIAQSSADLPLRLGTKPTMELQPGQTTISLDLGVVAAGWSTEAEWWGPGIRNALVMSNNAAGIPRFFLGTPVPVRTRIGALSARWIAGILSESRFFERQNQGVTRPLSGLVITLSPRVDTNLSFGIARVVYRRRTESGAPWYVFDVLTRWTVRKEEGDGTADQLTSVFGRWVFPRSGLEMYGEWGRVVLPSSLRSFLIAPQYSQGYTLGLQWLTQAPRSGTSWRMQFEATNLDQLRLPTGESPPSFYTSPVISHGYTQRGRVIGAAVGSGGSSQWLAIDRGETRWSAGIFGGRTRHEHDEHFRRPSGLSIFGHDVSLYGGVRGDYRGRHLDYAVECLAEQRTNYLFQHALGAYGMDRTFDVHNLSMRLSVYPGRRARVAQQGAATVGLHAESMR